MTYPKMKACPKCGDEAVELHGYSWDGFAPFNWHVECDECLYMGPAGNKLTAIRQHNALAVATAPDREKGAC